MLSVVMLYVAFFGYADCHNAEGGYAAFSFAKCYVFIVMLSVVMLTVVPFDFFIYRAILCVVMLSLTFFIVMLSITMLSVAFAEYHYDECRHAQFCAIWLYP
jgi:hypothetical protein